MNSSEIPASRKILNTLTSMKLAIIVLIILAVLSIGAVLFQDWHPTNFDGWQEYYNTELSPWKYKLYTSLQLFTPYRSWWFISLLSLLSVSILLCSITNVKGMFKIAFSRNNFRSSDAISGLKNYSKFSLPESTAVPACRSVLRKKAYRTSIKSDPDNVFIYWKRNGLSRIGPFLSHIGLLALFIGGIVSALWGQSQFLWGEPGKTISAPFADHKVFVNDFKIIKNENGQIKDYVSQLTVIGEDGEPVLEKKVEVNQPLRYHGVSYYQSSYQLHPRKLKQALLVVKTPHHSSPDTIRTGFRELSPIKDTDLSIRVADFAVDFKITDQGVISNSRELRNPAALVQFFEQEKEIKHQWVFANFPSFHSSDDSTFQVSLLNFEPMYATGLQASVNPASPFIWAGFAIMSLGICFAFFLNHRQIWAVVSLEKGQRDIVHIAGSAHKFKDQFSQELQEMIKNMKKFKAPSGELSPLAAEEASPLDT